MPEFRPVCPSCDYDLSGLPGSICPECGRAFDLTALRVAWETRQLGFNRAVSAHWLVLVVSILSWPCMGLLLQTGEPSTVFLLIIVLLILRWAWLKREVLARTNPWLSLWLVIPLSACWTDRSMGTYGWFSILAFGAILVTWMTVGRRTWVLPLILGALFLSVPGVSWLQEGLRAFQRGNHWSAVADPRMGQVYDQYPLTTAEALVLGVATSALCALLLTLAAHADLSRRRSGASIWRRSSARTTP